jgi:hypothetical protein
VHRRHELGLEAEEVARRSGLDVAYLRRLEEGSEAHASGDAIVRLARALETTPASLAGGDMGQPPGSGRASPHPILHELTREECESHLVEGGVGRVVFVAEQMPVAFPVNFRYRDGAIIFWTAADASIAECFDSTVSFEVDRLDEAASEGWSVLVTGRAERPAAHERAEYIRLEFEPWAGGYRDTLVRIAAAKITGREVRQTAR